MSEPKRVALYARVSTEEQAEHGFSIDAQLGVIRDYARKSGKEIVREYVDRGVSGKSMERRYELQQLLKGAEVGLFDEVVVWKFNRLARTSLDLLKIVDHLSSHNVAFRSVSENFETETPMGKFSLQMMGAVGELERNTIVDNVKMGMKQRARMGKWNGGVTLGYQSKLLKSSANRRERETILEIVPDEARTVQKIFELYASGKGLKAIANQLNHEGYKTKKGNPFGVTAISGILKNELYVGNICYNRREDWAEKRRKGINKNPIVVKGQHEPIVSQELWDRVQSLYSKKSGKSPRIFQGSFPLTGILRCPQCNSGMVSHRTKDKLKDGTVVYRRYYVCGAFQNKGSAVCKSNGIRADETEQEVFDRLRRAVTKPKVLQDVVKAINNKRMGHNKPLETDLKHVEKSLESVQIKTARWYELYETDGINQGVLLERLNQLKAESEALESRRSALQAALGSQTPLEPVPAVFVKTVLAKFHELLHASPPEQQKALLHMMVRRIEVQDRKVGKIEIHLDERLQSSFLNEGPSDSPEGPFDSLKDMLPLTIPL